MYSTLSIHLITQSPAWNIHRKQSPYYAIHLSDDLIWQMPTHTFYEVIHNPTTLIFEWKCDCVKWKLLWNGWLDFWRLTVILCHGRNHWMEKAKSQFNAHTSVVGLFRNVSMGLILLPMHYMQQYTNMQKLCYKWN